MHASGPAHRRPQCATCVIGRAAPPGQCPFRPTRLPSGTLLHAQGETPERVHYLCAGTVLLSTSDESGAEVSCSLRGPGSLIGLERLSARPATHDAWALGAIECCVIGADAVESWLGERAVPLGAMLELALDENEHSRRERTALSGRTITRVARFLDAWRRERGESELDVEQQVLARMLSMRAETLSRVLARLRRDGVITPTGLRVLAPDLLAALAHPDE